MSADTGNQGAVGPAPKRSNVVKILHWGDNPAKIVCLLGSTRFQGEFLSAAKAFTLQGSVVLLPGYYTQRDGVGLDKEEQELIQELDLKRIEMADTVFVVNPNNRIPESVHKQIEYAKSLGRIVRYLETPST
jgi:hypothetical protein